MSQSINPYESPSPVDHELCAGKRIVPSGLGIASTGLIIMSILHGIAVWDLAAMLSGTGIPDDKRFLSYYWLGSILPVGLIFIAALFMRQRRCLWICRVGAVLACIPFVTPVMYFGLPFGIWAAVLLFRPATVSQFARVSHD
jgi:hypothetical protein